MKWYWLLTVLVAVSSLAQSDASKRERWKAQAEAEYSTTADRIGDLILITLAVWQSIVLWGAR